MAERNVPIPQIVKIDVEGHELDVLSGMGDMLRQKGRMAVSIEVHFDQLDRRGMPDGARRIEDVAARSGFGLRWINSSHLVMTRGWSCKSLGS